MAKAAKSDLEQAQRLFAAERRAFADRVYQANRSPSLEERAAALGALVEYDPDDDTLYIAVGSSPPTEITHQVREGLYVHVAPDTLLIVGIEVRHFAEAVVRDGEVRNLFGSLSSAIMHLREFRVEPSSPGARALAEDLGRMLVA